MLHYDYAGAREGVHGHALAALATDLGMTAVDAELDRRTREVIDLHPEDSELLFHEDGEERSPERFRRQLMHAQVIELRDSAIDAVMARLRAAVRAEVDRAERRWAMPDLRPDFMAWRAMRAQATRERAQAELDDLDDRLEAA